MSEENISQEFRLRKIAEIRKYVFKEINQNELMSKKLKKVCRILNYIENLFIVIFTITGCVSISDFASLVSIHIGITSSADGLKILAITEGIKKYKSIIKEKNKKHNKIVLLAKSKLNSIEVLICKVLVDLNISHGVLILINNVLKSFYDMKKEIENSNDK